MYQWAMRTNPNLADRFRPVCCSCRRITQTTCFRSTVVSATDISCRLTRMEASNSGSDPKSGNNSATKRCLQALPSRPHQILTPLRPYTLPYRSPLSRSSKVVAAVLLPVSSPGLPVSSPVSSPPDSVATHLVVSTISSTFSSKSAIAKFRNARQTKMADVDSNIQHRHVTLKNLCTKLVRWPLGVQMQNLFPKIRCVSWKKIIFQLLSCLYLYDSGIQVLVHIRKQSRYTDAWR